MATAKSIPHQPHKNGAVIPSVNSWNYPYWAFDYPSAPGYGNGCASGKAAHLALVKHLQNPNYQYAGGFLQQLVLELAAKLSNAHTEDERDTVRGKIVGIFSQMEQLLHCAARYASTEENSSTTAKSIHRLLQDAAEGGPKKRMELKIKAEASERARNAANIRRQKRKAPTLVAV